MKIKAFFLILFAFVLVSACSSSSDSKKCEENDLGYLKLTIPNSSDQTAVSYTKVNNAASFGSQTIGAHKTSAKLEIPSGTYNIVVQQVNSNGQATSDNVLFSNVIIEQCETVSETVTSFN